MNLKEHQQLENLSGPFPSIVQKHPCSHLYLVKAMNLKLCQLALVEMNTYPRQYQEETYRPHKKQQMK